MRWGRILFSSLLGLLILIGLFLVVPSGRTYAESLEETSVDDPMGVLQTGIEWVKDTLLAKTDQVEAAKESNSETPLFQWFWKTLQKLIALLIVSGLFAWLLPDAMTTPLAVLKTKTGRSFGVGALMFVIFPLVLLAGIGIIVLLVFLFNVIKMGNLAGTILIIGLVGLLILILGYVLVLSCYIKAVLGLWLGQLALSLIKKEWAKNIIISALIGAFLVAILVKIPWVGWFISLIMDLAGLGAIWLSLKRSKATS